MNPNKAREKTEEALLRQGYRVQFRCTAFTLFFKPDVLSSIVKLLWVDADGHITSKPLSDVLEEVLHE